MNYKLVVTLTITSIIILINTIIYIKKVYLDNDDSFKLITIIIPPFTLFIQSIFLSVYSSQNKASMSYCIFLTIGYFLCLVGNILTLYNYSFELVLFWLAYIIFGMARSQNIPRFCVLCHENSGLFGKFIGGIFLVGGLGSFYVMSLIILTFKNNIIGDGDAKIYTNKMINYTPQMGNNTNNDMGIIMTNTIFIICINALTMVFALAVNYIYMILYGIFGGKFSCIGMALFIASSYIKIVNDLEGPFDYLRLTHVIIYWMALMVLGWSEYRKEYQENQPNQLDQLISSNANNCQTNANNYQSNVDNTNNYQTNANNYQTNANNYQTKANNYQTNADNANTNTDDCQTTTNYQNDANINHQNDVNTNSVPIQRRLSVNLLPI